MTNATHWRIIAAGLMLSMGIAGCTSTPDYYNNERALADELASSRAENQRLRSQVGSLEARGVETRVVEVVSQSSQGTADLPPANPGECYARVLIPAVYETQTQEIIQREAGQHVEIIDAEYQWIEETVLVKDAGEEIVEVIPAEYQWIEETVVVKDASERVEIIPAKYETVTEEVVVRPGYAVWKAGRGPLERIDHATGEIMCRVEVPAEYKTITREVLVSPEHVERVPVPAEYETIRKRLMVRPPEVIRREVPAEYDVIRKQVLVTPAQEVRVDVPAVYGTVTQEVLVSEAYMDWRPILCETNITTDLISQVQQSLRDNGYSPGPIDGRFGQLTLSALRRYQRANSLSEGGLTVETIEHLGVRVR